MTTRENADHAAFLEYWKSLRKPGATLVTSEDFLDAASPLFSPNVLVLDVYEDDLIVRLVATEIVQRWGYDLTGKSLFNAPLPMKQKDMLSNVHKLIDQPCGLLSVNITNTSGGRAVALETFGLPVAVQPDRPRRMVNYSWLIDPLEDGEHSEDVARYERQEWIDLGAGVPDSAPLKPMVNR